jgi:hypothetical protein
MENPKNQNHHPNTVSDKENGLARTAPCP